LVDKQVSCTIIKGDDILTDSYEIVGCTLHAGGDLKFKNDITIFCAYLPPDISAESFDVAMKSICTLWPSESVCIIVGDFNLPDIDWLSEHPRFNGSKSIALHDMFTDLACSQFISSPTRGNNVLDLLFCNDPMLISDVSVDVPFSNSDHAMIFFTIYSFGALSPAVVHDTNPEIIPVWEKADWNSLRQFFENIAWDESIFD
jgi:hypothetical protein